MSKPDPLKAEIQQCCQTICVGFCPKLKSNPLIPKITWYEGLTVFFNRFNVIVYVFLHWGSANYDVKLEKAVMVPKNIKKVTTCLYQRRC